MRDYSVVKPQFWTGSTGRQIRKMGRDAQVLALYLMSCPSSNMLGLYYLPLPTIAHETGLTLQGASKGLRSLSEADFCDYDKASEVVWVRKMATYQIAEQLDPNDKRVKWVWRELLNFKNTKFFRPFCDRYQKNFHIPVSEFLNKSGGPSEAPSKTLRSQDQDQDQDQDQEHSHAQKVRGRSAAMPISRATMQAYSEAYEKRYGVPPVKNQKTNAIMAQLVKRLGQNEAPQIAAFFLTIDSPLYVSARHPATLLLRDAEGLRTRWAAGPVRSPLVGPRAFQKIEPAAQPASEECPPEVAEKLSRLLGRPGFDFPNSSEGAA